MFTREVRFYREIAPTVGVRVPRCYRAVEHQGSTLLELEDLSSWRLGADPVAAARALATLHERWEDGALSQWAWLERPDATGLVESLFNETWQSLRDRSDITPVVRDLGDGLVGQVSAVERRAGAVGRPTLLHGDPSTRNMRTSPAGEVAFLDWEDVGIGPGAGDLAWLLISSVVPSKWDAVVTAYGGAPRLSESLPAAAVQGLLSLAGEDGDGVESLDWIARLEESARRM